MRKRERQRPRVRERGGTRTQQSAFLQGNAQFARGERRGCTFIFCRAVLRTLELPHLGDLVSYFAQEHTFRGQLLTLRGETTGKYFFHPVTCAFNAQI